ncbi:hypothetical protein DSAG12_02242 [Promethearchaeum syntrophicum]|uniref:Uncharacterized protein n=1 Tax=Promethearchaeum syntrophicum TaxID=2594042 RepID=A0A5B9DBC7_9ARCH|nr:hypothetical protein [Candidatus Prometheoarchaeum syntrophicum]QEE16412.1 hypothetical protein DSAG12_02242 [Candidatus Prometheoarchaeum syntrophicum]
MKKSKIIIKYCKLLKKISDLLDIIERLTKNALSISKNTVFYNHSDQKYKIQLILFDVNFIGFFEFCYLSLCFNNIGCYFVEIQEIEARCISKIRINATFNVQNIFFGTIFNSKEEYTNKNQRDKLICPNNILKSYPIGCLT